jgi:hypothetical protein
MMFEPADQRGAMSRIQIASCRPACALDLRAALHNTHTSIAEMAAGAHSRFFGDRNTRPGP